MPRIAGVEPNKASLFVRAIYALAKRGVGKVTGRAELIEPVKNMAHHPRVLFGIGQLDLAIEAAKSVPARYKQLAMLRVARLVECPF